jgi:hypothetical protein
VKLSAAIQAGAPFLPQAGRDQGQTLDLAATGIAGAHIVALCKKACLGQGLAVTLIAGAVHIDEPLLSHQRQVPGDKLLLLCAAMCPRPLQLCLRVAAQMLWHVSEPRRRW